MKDFNVPWQQLIYSPLIGWGEHVNPRGMLTKEQLGWRMVFEPWQRFIHHKRLPLNFDYMTKELEWYIKGEYGDVSIAEHAEIWKKSMNPDGTLTSNYGHLLWGRIDRPLFRAIQELKKDLFSRRAFAHILRPEHFLDVVNDVPCTVGMQFLVRKEQLFTVVTMRSQDAVYGLRNDLPFFHFVSDVLCRILDLRPAKISLSVGSFHIYERHFAKVMEVVRYPFEWVEPKVDWEEEVTRVVQRLTSEG